MYADNWDLECFFQGGSSSAALQLELERIKEAIVALDSLKEPHTFPLLVEKMQNIEASLKECDSFILCCQSQDIADGTANQLRAEFTLLDAKFQLFGNQFDDFLVQMDLAAFQSLISDPNLADIRYVLEERRIRGSQKLTPEKEDLITRLSVDGYHSWGNLYPLLVGEIKIPFEENGKKQELSFGQAENKLSHPERRVRQEVFTRLESAWEAKAPLFADVLNHIAGFRLEVYEQRGWANPLQEPLFENRMSEETLDAMWDAVLQFKKPLVAYIQAKAKLLNLPSLSWYDLETPLTEAEVVPIPYPQGAEQIIEQFEQFFPRMGVFAKRACSEKWIEAEDRLGKRPGGYCCSFPKSGQSRIFMTYSGTMVNISTLAHELGHAYHTEMIKDLPSFSQNYRMNVAETASTFAEQIISDALLREADTREKKIKILSERIERAIIFMMNIHARFIFEKQFYQKRKEKFQSSNALCKMMKDAQEIAYCGALSQWHPYFWAAKMHFYFTDVPFYNFPYTFGYLFSLGIYNRAKKEGVVFADNYDALLRESGMMSVEDLAEKHLGVDLRQPDFWMESCAAAVADVDEFLKLV